MREEQETLQLVRPVDLRTAEMALVFHQVDGHRCLWAGQPQTGALRRPVPHHRETLDGRRERGYFGVDPPVPWNHDAHVVAPAGQHLWERASDIAKPADLDQWGKLRSDEQYLHRTVACRPGGRLRTDVDFAGRH